MILLIYDYTALASDWEFYCFGKRAITRRGALCTILHCVVWAYVSIRIDAIIIMRREWPRVDKNARKSTHTETFLTMLRFSELAILRLSLFSAPN